MANTKFKTLRTVRIASLTGHVVIITPDEPVALPPEIHAEAFAMGCVPVDTEEHVVPTKQSAEIREKAIEDAIHTLIARNQEKDFKKSGNHAPKVASVVEILGFDVLASEIDKIFDAMNVDMDDGETELSED